MPWFVPQQAFKGFLRWQCRAVLYHKSPETPPVAFASQAAGQQSQLKATSGFIPCAEFSSRDVFPDAFFAATEKRKLPIVNRPSPIGRQMSDPALAKQRNHQSHGAVLDEVRSVQEHYAGAALARGDNSGRAVVDQA